MLGASSIYSLPEADIVLKNVFLSAMSSSFVVTIDTLFFGYVFKVVYETYFVSVPKVPLVAYLYLFCSLRSICTSNKSLKIKFKVCIPALLPFSSKTIDPPGSGNKNELLFGDSGLSKVVFVKLILPSLLSVV